MGLHDQPAYQVSDDEIKRESMFREVLKEVNAVRDYLDWLVEEGAAAAAEDAAAENGGEAAGGKTFADVLAERASAAAEGGEVELFGGGGDAPASSEAPKDTEYRPSLRSDLGSSVLLTGTVDPGLLSVLNNNFFGRESVPNFQFSTIKALVDDVAGAKKRAIGREARYGGLLDKLVVEEASGALPSAEELGGATCWIAEVTAGEAKQLLPQMAALASGASELENLVVMVTGSSGTVEGWDAVKSSAEAGSFKATLLSVGDLYDGGSAGGFCHVGRLGEDLTPAEGRTAKLSKAKAYQLLAHLLALDCASNVELAAYEYTTEVLEKVVVPYGEGEFAERDDEGKELPDEQKDVKMEQRMVRAVREAGFTPVMELDVLVGRGLAAYKAYLDNPPNRESSISASKSARDKEDEKIMAMLEADIAKSDARKAAEAEEAKRIEIEGIAREWCIKEYSLRMLGGILDEGTSEQDFTVAVWGEALEAAEETYERIRSDEYKKELERSDRARADATNKLFWEGMSPELRKRRELMVEKVKRQYMDLLSEEELERIILNE